MSNLRRAVCAFLPHLLLALSLMAVLFRIIHQFNPFMQFLDSRLSQVFWCIYTAVTLAAAYSAGRAGRNRTLAAAVSLLSAALIMPVIRAISAGDCIILTRGYFLTVVPLAAICTFAFSVCEIFKMRKNAQNP